MRTQHEPRDPADIASNSPARLRLAYDELFAHQLALMLLRASLRQRSGRMHQAEGKIAAKITDALPYRLTNAQSEALAQIGQDLEAPARMLRLLQGDVGSGKTVVALLAMAHVVEAGRQAALMAPTEILARQHYEGMVRFAEAAGLRLAVLTGRDRAAERARTLAALAEGAIDIVIGTHALFQENVAFRDLGLAVVDEQHRFGVHQRLALGEKGAGTDILVMTATPIPRTLVLTYFGDMDISEPARKAAGPAADRDACFAARPAGRSRRADGAGDCLGGRAPIGSVRSLPKAKSSLWPPPKSASRCSSSSSERRSDFCTAS